MTNWDNYYEKPYPSAHISRWITAKLLVRLIKKYSSADKVAVVLELGGANSCFLEPIQSSLKPTEYHIVDNNRVGMELLKHQVEAGSGLILHLQDVRNMALNTMADLVFSVGLVEHFSADDLSSVIGAHFTNLKPGGTAIITFPTPTFLYRISRWVSEWLGLWIFTDEIPITISKMIELTSAYGAVLHTRINWLILFTQGIVVIRSGG